MSTEPRERLTTPRYAEVIGVCEALVMFAAACCRHKPSDVARAFNADEARSILHCVELAEQWLEQFATNLGNIPGRPNEMCGDSMDRRPRPRNKLAFERGQAVRARIEQFLLSHNQLAPPLTEKRIWPRLNPRISERQIRRHLQAIRSRARSE
jgi:hypothetical protein